MDDQPRDLLGDPVADLADDILDDSGRWPERIAEMIDLLLHEITAAGIARDPRQARMLAVRQVAGLCRAYGGGREYWPKVDSLERAQRDATIWAEHDGTRDGAHGISALARKHGLSDNQVWSILRRERARHRRRVQGKLGLSG